MAGRRDPNEAKKSVGDWSASAAITSFHGIMLVGALIVMLLSFLMTTNEFNQVFLPGIAMAMPESCVTKMYLGFDCPGCGMTRAFIKISDGRFVEAWQLNSASFVVYLFFAIQIPWHGMQLTRIAKGKAVVDSWLTILPALAVIVTLVVCWIWRV